MRTTITLDDDVAREIHARAKQSDKSFKEILNESLRLAFSVSRSPLSRLKPFRVHPHKSAFRAGIDAAKLNQLVDELEVDSRKETFLKEQLSNRGHS